MFAAAGLAEEMKVAADVLPVEVEVITFTLLGGDGFAVEFANQDIGERFEDRGGGGCKGVGDAEFETAVTGLDERIGVGEAAEFDGKCGQWGAGADGAEDLAANFSGVVVVKPGELELAALDLHVF